MATDIGIGFSQKIDPAEAAREASVQAKIQADQSNFHFVLILSTIHYPPKTVLQIVQDHFSDAKIIGASTAGIILSHNVFKRGIAVLVIWSEEIHFGVHAVENLPRQDIRHAGLLLGQKSAADLELHRRQLFLYLIDSMVKDHFLLLKGLQEVFGTVFPIIGAGSSDDFRLKSQYQLARNLSMTQSATGVLMGGHMSIGFGSKHGWKPLGKPRFIDKVEGPLIKTIDGKRASHIYEEYFQEVCDQNNLSKMGTLSTLFPLGMYLQEDNKYLLRHPLQVLEDGSIECQGELLEGSEVHIMIANKDSCIQAAYSAAIEAHQSLLGKKAQLVLIFESLTRLKLLGRSAVQEIQTIKEVFGYKTPILGMYSFGEITPWKPLDNITKTHLQNGSFTIVAIG